MTKLLADEPSALDVGIEFARRLRERDIPHALGGALALGANGLLRATRDVDLNVFVDPPELAGVFDVLNEAGVAVDRAAATAAADAEGLFIVWAGPWRIDIFTPSIDFAWEARRTAVEYRFGDQQVAFLSAEALAVFKLLFFRGKDLVDLEQLAAIRSDLDTA